MVDIVIGQTTALNPNAPGPKTHGTETEKWPPPEEQAGPKAQCERGNLCDPVGQERPQETERQKAEPLVVKRGSFLVGRPTPRCPLKPNAFAGAPVRPYTPSHLENTPFLDPAEIEHPS